MTQPNEEYLRKASTSVASKHSAATEWRHHLRGQYHDRLVYWHLRWFSRLRSYNVVTVIIDSMDKAKLAWPQYAFRKPKCLDRWARPRLVVTGAIAHGYCTNLYLTDDEAPPHAFSTRAHVGSDGDSRSIVGGGGGVH